MTKISRNTKQKELIEKEIDNTNTFFSSENIYSKVKKKDNKLGIATVYRLLKEMRNKGKIHSYMCDKKIIYSKNHHSHTHFICEKCGRTEHLNIKNINFIKKQISKEICHFQLDIYGLCDKCIKN